MTELTIETIYKLSPLQEGMLFHTLRDPASGVYIVQYSCTLRGELDVVAFERAWQRVIDRQPVLRTAFIWEDIDDPVQVVQSPVKAPLGRQDWRNMLRGEQEERLQAYLQIDRRRGFELANAPLMRFILIQIADHEYYFVWSFHHILLDGWSVPIILKKVFNYYDAIQQGKELHIEQERPYRDYITWLQQRDISGDKEFWQRTLKGFTEPVILANGRPSEDSIGLERCDTESVSLSVTETDSLQRFARGRQLTVNTIMQGAWALLLSRHADREDIVYGTTLSGRPTDLAGVESMVGLFINTLPIRIQLPPHMSLISWLSEIQNDQVKMREFQYSPLVKVQSWSGLPGNIPMFESILVFENYPIDSSLNTYPANLKIDSFRNFEHTNFPIAMVVTPGQELLLKVLYHTNRFEASTIKQMLARFVNLLRVIISTPERRLSDINLLSAEEDRRLLIELNQTQTSYPRDATVVESFESQVARAPEAGAIVIGGAELSYLELNRRANQFAHYLISKGIRPEVRAAIYMRRGTEMIVAMIAILKAGGVYVPLDPDYPAERLAYMLKDAEVAVVLTQQSLVERLPKYGGLTLCLDTQEGDFAKHSAANPPPSCIVDNLAYVMYTSGTTGKPKGICVTHRAIIRLVKSTNYVSLTERDVMLQMAPVSFDAATFEIWGALLNGGKLALYTGHSAVAAEIGTAIKQYGVTTLWLTAGLFHLTVDEGLEELKGVEQLLAGGDVLSVRHTKKCLQEAGIGRLINGYGPTEGTTFTCCHIMTSPEDIGASVPIGKPIANTQVYLTDTSLRPVPIGVNGELHIGGDGLARGYLGKPELTAEQFIPNPFSNERGSRLYKTGDMARYRPTVEIEFLYRTDHQVKLRGFRVELEEIEATLMRHPDVQTAVITARGVDSGERQLIAYVVLKDQRRTGVGELRDFLKEFLPTYMMPSGIVLTNALPLTANGKVDRRSLPIAEEPRPETQMEGAAPRTETEEMLVKIWAEVLGIKHVGIHDNFFDLGGHSLLATRLISRVREKLCLELPVNVFLLKVFSADASTVEGMAKAIEEYQIEQVDIEELEAMLQEQGELSDDEVRALLVSNI
jgi:surfactin family lipopeptide synthetase C